MSTIDLVHHLIQNTRRSTRTTGGVPMSALDLVIAGCKIDLDVNTHRARAPQGLGAEEFTTGWEDELPQVKPLQAQTLRNNGVNAAEGRTLPLVTPRTTRTKRQDTGSPEGDVARKRTKSYLFLGVVRKLMHLNDASAISPIIRKGACPLMSKHMMERVILRTT